MSLLISMTILDDDETVEWMTSSPLLNVHCGYCCCCFIWLRWMTTHRRKTHTKVCRKTGQEVGMSASRRYECAATNDGPDSGLLVPPFLLLLPLLSLTHTHTHKQQTTCDPPPPPHNHHPLEGRDMSEQKEREEIGSGGSGSGCSALELDRKNRPRKRGKWQQNRLPWLDVEGGFFLSFFRSLSLSLFSPYFNRRVYL